MKDVATPSSPMKTTNLKIGLLVLASAFVIAMLVYSNRITAKLLTHEQQVVDLYAKSYEYITSDRASSGDFSFLFEEVIGTIDFPVILTDVHDNPLYWKNVKVDTSLTLDQQREVVRPLLPVMDRHNKPIKIALNDTTVLNYVHYGESDLIVQLRWLPVWEILLAAVFIFVAYVGFTTIKRTEQSNIWVGMAKETAHQLGTPLSSIIGWLERARADGEHIPAVAESLQEIGNDIERLNKVAARFSKIGSRPDLKDEDLAEVIRGVIAYIAKRIPRSGKRVDLIIATPGEFRAFINRDLFEWVVENLMKNALDAMEGPSGRVTFHLTQSGRRTTIDVTDTGKGIDPRFHKDVFRPGYSTKKRGWGLGLSLSKRIIEEYHKGKLFVKQSTPGEGTTFRIRLG
jgi:signal transduction histidine kinase